MNAAADLEDDGEVRFYDTTYDEPIEDDIPTPQPADVLPRDQQRKTAFYDYASEKSLSLTDAKLFYQHQLEQQTSTDSQNVLGRTWKASPVEEDIRGYGDKAEVRFRGPSDVDINHSASSTGLKRPNEPLGASSDDLLGNTRTRPSRDPDAEPELDALLAADQSARSHSVHPKLPHELKPSFLSEQGVHGAGAGVGIGNGMGGFAIDDSAVTSELTTIYSNIQKILDMRHSFIRLSLQRPGDNPKDDSIWEVYPAPPEPVWDEENNRPVGRQSGPRSRDDLKHARTNTGSGSSVKQHPRQSDGAAIENSTPPKKRKPGQDIGEDFDMSDLLPLPEESEMTFKLDDSGVFQVYENSTSTELETPILSIPTIRDFYVGLDAILQISSDGPTKSFAFRRLQFLEGKYNLYFLLNEYQEMADSKRVPHRDFYNVRKVDTHVHHSSCMNQKHLLRFIKSKMKKSPDELVLHRDGKHLTLREVFESINLTAYDLSIDTLDMHVRTILLVK